MPAVRVEKTVGKDQEDQSGKIGATMRREYFHETRTMKSPLRLYPAPGILLAIALGLTCELGTRDAAQAAATSNDVSAACDWPWSGRSRIPETQRPGPNSTA